MHRKELTARMMAISCSLNSANDGDALRAMNLRIHSPKVRKYSAGVGCEKICVDKRRQSVVVMVAMNAIN